MASYEGGPEFLVNTTTRGEQRFPAITSLASGGFVISWEDESGEGVDADIGIKAQIFDALGAKVGPEFLVNTTTSLGQHQPTIASLDSGGFVVSWIDFSGQGADASSTGIKAQIFAHSGEKVGPEFLVNTETLDFQSQPTLTSLTSGGFVISWIDFSGQGGDTSGYGIKAQIFAASGAKVGAEFLVNTTTLNHQFGPTITSLASGGFVVSWQDHSDESDGAGGGIKAQIFDASGAKVGSEFLVNTTTALFDQNQPTITSLASGGFVVSWQDESGEGGDADIGIKAQIFDASGAKVGAEFLVNTATLNWQLEPTITSLPLGEFVVSWQDHSAEGGIKAQIFDAAGAKVGQEFRVNTATLDFQGLPTIASLASGGFVVSWMDDRAQGGDASPPDIKARIFDAPVLNAIKRAKNDFNADGHSDILWRHSSGTITDWLGTDNGGFIGNGANVLLDVPLEWQIAGTGDFNGDGKDDILWRNSSGTITNWLGTDSGSFTGNGANALLDVPNEWQIAGTGDFNGDGKDDILWRNSSGTITNWLGTDTGSFNGNGANAFLDVPNEWQIAGTGDFNGDGKDDILWRNGSGTITNWLGTDNGGLIGNGANAFYDVPNEWQVAGLGDFNGDGKDDILWRNGSGTITNWLATDSGGFIGNGANAFYDVPNEWQVAGLGDFNGDGKDDILWRNSSGTITNWLGTDTGSFTGNGANAFYDVPVEWISQPDLTWAGLWDL